MAVFNTFLKILKKTRIMNYSTSSRYAENKPIIISEKNIGQIVMIDRTRQFGFVTANNLTKENIYFDDRCLFADTYLENLSLNDIVEYSVILSKNKTKKNMAANIRKISAKMYYFIVFNPNSYKITGDSSYGKINPFETVFFLGKIEHKYKGKITCTGIFEPFFYKNGQRYISEKRCSFDNVKKIFEKRLEGSLTMDIPKPNITKIERISEEEYQKIVKKYKYVF